MSRNFELLSQIENEFAALEQGTAAHGASSYGEPDVRKASGEEPYPKEILELTQRIFLPGNMAAPHQVMFCAVEEEANSGTVCARVAHMLASLVRRPVCALDANVSSQHLSAAMDMDSAIGLGASVKDASVSVDGNLWFAGPSVVKSTAGALLPSTELKVRLAELRRTFEFVVIDAPPASLSGDAAMIGQFVDAAVLVVEAGQTRRAAARKAKEVLETAHVRLLGTVLNNRTFPIPQSLYRRL